VKRRQAEIELLKRRSPEQKAQWRQSHEDCKPPSPAGPQRSASRQFLAACGSPRQQQVGHVRAGQQQHHPSRWFPAVPGATAARVAIDTFFGMRSFMA